MITDHLFVYGLLRLRGGHKMGQYLKEHATFISEATIQGKLFQIEDYPGVILSEKVDEITYGDLFKIRDEELLLRLDEFEGVGDTFSEPNEYKRELVDVSIPGGSIKAWIYTYHWPLAGKRQIPSGDFLHP